MTRTPEKPMKVGDRVGVTQGLDGYKLGQLAEIVVRDREKYGVVHYDAGGAGTHLLFYIIPESKVEGHLALQALLRSHRPRPLAARIADALLPWRPAKKLRRRDAIR